MGGGWCIEKKWQKVSWQWSDHDDTHDLDYCLTLFSSLRFSFFYFFLFKGALLVTGLLPLWKLVENEGLCWEFNARRWRFSFYWTDKAIFNHTHFMITTTRAFNSDEFPLHNFPAVSSGLILEELDILMKKTLAFYFYAGNVTGLLKM